MGAYRDGGSQVSKPLDFFYKRLKLRRKKKRRRNCIKYYYQRLRSKENSCTSFCPCLLFGSSASKGIKM
jgi:hypothetical protein